VGVSTRKSLRNPTVTSVRPAVRIITVVANSPGDPDSFATVMSGARVPPTVSDMRAWSLPARVCHARTVTRYWPGTGAV
jgi:hypothetical protein